jgi:hypothetical protein
MIPEVPGTTLLGAKKDSLDLPTRAVRAFAKENMKFAPPLEDMPRQTARTRRASSSAKIPDRADPADEGQGRQRHFAVGSGAAGEAGLLKMDFLGLKTLTVVREAART